MTSAQDLIELMALQQRNKRSSTLGTTGAMTSAQDLIELMALQQSKLNTRNNWSNDFSPGPYRTHGATAEE